MRGFIFSILLLGTSASAQISFQSVGCTVMCTPEYWQEADIARSLDTIASLSRVDAEDEDGRTALYYAAVYGTPDQVAALLSRGADPNGGDNPLEGVLSEWAQRASYFGQESIDRTDLPGSDEMLAKLAVLTDEGSTPPDMEKAVTHAGVIGDVRVLDLLAQFPEFDEAIAAKSFDVLLLSLDNPEMFSKLLAAGADPTQMNEDGDTLLHALIPAAGIVYLNNLLAEDQNQPAYDLVSPIRHLLALGLDPDMRDSTGRTPLMLAAQSGLSDVMTLLLDQGADASATSATGAGVLHFFFINRDFDPKLFDRLVDEGADPTLLVGPDISLLHVAAMQPSVQDLDILLPYFDEIDLRNGTGETPLYLALRYGRTTAVPELPQLTSNVPNLSLIKWFIENGADINATDAEGATALFWRLFLESPNTLPETVQALQDLGAEALAPNGISCDLDDFLDPNMIQERRGSDLFVLRTEQSWPCEVRPK